jgi:two-component system, NtrC family, sensor kinase
VGLRLRLFLVLVLPLIAVVGGYGSIRVRQEGEQRLENNRRNVGLAAKGVAIAVENALRDRKFSDVARLLSEMVEDQEEIDRIRLFDGNMHPIVVSNRLPLGEDVPAEALQRVFDSGRSESLYERHEGKLVLYHLAPIRTARGSTQAVMEVVQLADAAQAQLRAAQWEVWLRLGALVVCVALVTSVILQRQVLRPLWTLMDGIRRLGRGESGPPLPVGRKDEFGRVAAAFNEMTERLKAARVELIEGAERTLDLEQQLRQAETLAVAGKLATAFAHEVGTPLNIISGQAEFLLRDLSADDPLRQDLAGIVQQIDRISGIIHSLLDAVRPQKPEFEAVRLRDVVAQLLPLVEHAARRDGVRISESVPAALPPVLADPAQVQQVVINLLVNAMEAAGSTGAVHLDARVARRGDRDGVAVAVTDSGPGIPVEHRGEIFKPFFTTKPRGKGTGLGLSICRDIVREHHGEITVEAPENGGTTFVVWLPCPEGVAA